MGAPKHGSNASGRADMSARRSISIRSERGFTLIEVLAACALISIGVASTLKIFGAAGRSVLRSERTDIAVQQAQAQLDRLRTVSYGALALTSAPAPSSDPKNPGSRVEGGSLRVRPDLLEEFVVEPAEGHVAQVDPAPTDFAVGLGGSTIRGHVYRFVTWRDESCPFALCPGSHNTKRVTVAVTLDPDPSGLRRPPMWFSTVIVDPSTAPPGTQAPPGGGPSGGDPVTAQSFFLYDTPCGEDSRREPGSAHATRDTASGGASAAEDSTCEHPDPAKQPDLMGGTAPPGDRSTPLFEYSNDVSGGYEGGLTMLHRGSTCAASYASADASSPDAVGKWSVHAWSTAQLTQPFALGGLVTVSLFTTTVGGVTAQGRVCVTLIDRVTTGGVPTDRVLGTGVYDLSSWPTDVRRLTFSFRLAQEEIVPAGHRLEMALHLHGHSGADISLLYDHPLYPSLLEVATSTPL
jgi:prepilin-type N-terminal cleavage/methylation domain-containing protein